jgi:hypothetical protein
MPDWMILPGWLTIPAWLEPKLLVLFLLIGTVLFLARGRSESVTNAGRRFTALLKHGKR